MNLNYNKIIPIRGDASFRKFYRRKNKHKTSIIVYANKEKEKNLLNYDAINKLLLKNKILAPKLYNQNYKNNYIEIQDLGKKTLFDILKKKGINKLKYFKKIIKILIKIQKIKQNKIKTLKKNIIKYQFTIKDCCLKKQAFFLIGMFQK